MKEAVAARPARVTLADLAAAVGASLMTIRKAVDEMIGARPGGAPGADAELGAAEGGPDPVPPDHAQASRR